jgi:hypothetical protein
MTWQWRPPAGYTGPVRASTIILLLGLLLLVSGVVLWMGDFTTLGAMNAAAGIMLVILAGVMMITGSLQSSPSEPSRIEGLDAARQHELLRGTSMHLRDMKFRLSIHYDDTGRAPFTREINTITLGFLPVVMLDNLSDKQGEGYVAFPFDGERWRGPGLPCVGGPDEAIEHAAKCVSPLEEPENEQNQ